ncbi:MAG TPA: SBBP repeat-containing protein [Pyrinomonadaceae bacterium]|nr:SBBP repeat-containing protein [Pyrinomonadaceae bacterium]
MHLTHLRNGQTFTASLLSLALVLGLKPAATRAVETSRTAPASAHINTAGSGRGVKKSVAQLPSFFEENAGQADPRARFVSRGAGHTLMLGAGGVTLALLKGGGKEGSGRAPFRKAPGENARGTRAPEPSYQLVNMRFVGANPRPEIVGEGALEGTVNYFVGRDASKWRAGLKTFSGVRYRELYPGVDLVFHGGDDGGRLEYDFVLAPGADHRDVRLSFGGADGLSIGKDGGLLLHTRAGTVSQSAPVIYQQIDGARRAVEGGYVLRGRNEVSFRVGEYDPAHALVIDPVLVYSTYFFSAVEMAVDSSGAVYVVGTAEAFMGELPATPGAFQTARRGLTDAFVAKLDPAGTSLNYLTYLGGTDQGGFDGLSDRGYGIAVDAAGNAYVTGTTETRDFPVTPGAFQTASGGSYEGFVTKLDPAGSSLVYSTYLGGGGSDLSRSIALDAAGSAYVAGGTTSNNFPVKDALQPTKKGPEDLFLTKFAPDGKSLVYSTHVGGSDAESGFDAHVLADAAGAAYLVGSTYSRDYPTTPGAYQTAAKTPVGFFSTEVAVSKFAPGGASLVYSTYVGGTHSDIPFGAALDAAGQVHVAGITDSPDFPVQGALHPTARDPQGNGFLSKLNAAGAGLVYSTYLSGTPRDMCRSRFISDVTFCGGEYATAVATDAAGNAYVTGITVSADFPAPSDPLQSNPNGPSDAYVIKLNPAGQALYATRLGGSSYDLGADIHAGPSGLVYLLGYTESDDFPTANAYRGVRAPGFDFVYGGFLAKLSEMAAPAGTSRVHFDSAAYTVGEAGRSAQVGVARVGDLSGEVSVDYSTSAGETASERSDFTTARGTLRFAPGKALKTFSVTVNDDRTVEGDESLTVTLTNLRGAAVLDAPADARLSILDDDEHPGTANPIDESEFFVRQHYLDFLSREPDAEGLQFWTQEIEQCGTDAQCREVKRINVSAAFFLSIEHQETAFLLERLYKLAFEARVPYRSFVKEARELGEGVVVGQGDWQARLAANRRAFAEEFVTRASFREQFPESLTPSQYVERLNARASGALSAPESAALVAGLEAGTETRASVLLKVADDEDFRRREFAPAFVLMQYLGYLRRDPDEGGYAFWLDKLNDFGGDFVRAEMVKAFLSSDEYRRRFFEPQKEAAFGTPFTVGFNETAILLPDKLRVTVIDVGFDSRCPRNVQCVHAGSLSILVEAVKPGGQTARFILSIRGQAPRPFPDNAPVSALGYNFRLLQADPEPPYPNPAPPFQAILRVDKP